MQIAKGQFWKVFRGTKLCVRFIVSVENTTVRYLQYHVSGQYPTDGSANSLTPEPGTELMSAVEAAAFIGNMEVQDARFQARQDTASVNSLVAAMQALAGRGGIRQVVERNNKVRVEMASGASFEIAAAKGGFTSTQTGLHDPE